MIGSQRRLSQSRSFLDARELARGGAEKVWKCMKKVIGGVGVGKAVLEQRSNEEQKYESGSEDESDDDEMEI